MSSENLIGRTVEGYEITELLGRGNYGQVFKGKKDGKEVALKVQKNEKDGLKEVKTMKHLRGVTGVPQLFFSGLFGNLFLIAMTLCGPSVNELRKKSIGKTFSHATIQKIAYQMVSILEAIHTIGFVHRDIKLDNLISSLPLSNVIQIMLCDFGKSCRYLTKDKQRVKFADKDKLHHSRLLHSSPFIGKLFDWTPLDDYIQLTFSLIHCAGHDMREWREPIDKVTLYKWKLVEETHEALPAKAKWMFQIFETIYRQNREEIIDFKTIQKAIQDSTPSDASVPIILTTTRGGISLQ